MLLANGVASGEDGATLLSARTFFGLHRVTRSQLDARAPANSLYHGTTLHGEQRVDSTTGLPSEARQPMSYYHRDGPLGDVFAAYGERLRRVGVVGLGTGAAAAYSESGQHYDFFEIDPTVVDIAEDRRYFTYLAEARNRGARIHITLGDARLALAEADDAIFDLLIVDAFSSDSIPIHLLTRDALAVYARTLRPSGLLVLHLSNRHLDLAPIVARLAADLGFSVAIRQDRAESAHGDDSKLRRRSEWAVLARTPQHLNALARTAPDSGWARLAVDPHTALWTDEYSNILQAVNW